MDAEGHAQTAVTIFAIVGAGAALQHVFSIDDAEEFAGMHFDDGKNKEVARGHAFGDGAQSFAGICTQGADLVGASGVDAGPGLRARGGLRRR